MLKACLYGLVLFATLGIAIATAILQPFGFQPQSTHYFALFGAALFFTLLLMDRSILLLCLVALLTVAVSLPGNVLGDFGFSVDKDILLSALVMIVIFPLVQRNFSH